MHMKKLVSKAFAYGWSISQDVIDDLRNAQPEAEVTRDFCIRIGDDVYQFNQEDLEPFKVEQDD